MFAARACPTVVVAIVTMSATPPTPPVRATHVLNLLGVPCPVNWAHAKARLETMQVGQILEVLVDDPRSKHDLPRAAEADGHCVVSVTGQGTQTRIVIEA